MEAEARRLLIPPQRARSRKQRRVAEPVDMGEIAIGLDRRSRLLDVPHELDAIAAITSDTNLRWVPWCGGGRRPAAHENQHCSYDYRYRTEADQSLHMNS